MRKLAVIGVILILLGLNEACCQEPRPEASIATDSVAIVDAHWQTDTLEGFYLKRHHFRHHQIFGANQYICILEIPAKSHCRLAFATDTVLTSTSSLAGKHNALAAVNGSYFDMDKGNPICYLRIDSVEFGENTPGKTDSVNRKYYQYGTLALKDGVPRILHTDSNRFWERQLSCKDIMTAGPLLIYRQEIQPLRDDRTFVTRRHNRTAIGLRPDGTILLLTIDGRFKNESEGVTLPELTKLLKWLGCSDALNLDGGGSTTMYVQGFSHDGVVNHPSDDNRYNHDGQRPVSNIVMIKK